jgi:hypothetical protein
VRRRSPGEHPGRRQPPQTTTANVTDGPPDEAVRPKLRQLRERHGYFTRAELGEVTPHHDPAEDWPVYDVLVLGLAPHPRDTCASCQAVGR